MKIMKNFRSFLKICTQYDTAQCTLNINHFTKCYGAENISLGSGSMEPQIQISAPAPAPVPAPAPAPDGFMRYLENYPFY
jgi:hypothetical protein